jgi:hypothetical protein
MQRALWQRLEAMPLAGEGNHDATNALCCDHCRGGKVHEVLHLAHQHDVCSLKVLSQTKARSAAKESVSTLDNDPSCDVAALVKSLCAKFA